MESKKARHEGDELRADDANVVAIRDGAPPRRVELPPIDYIFRTTVKPDPFPFWFVSDHGMALPFAVLPRPAGMAAPVETDDDFFCGCIELTFAELDDANPGSFLLASFARRGEPALFRPAPFADLAKPAKDLLQWCLDFLLYRRDSKNEEFPKRDTSGRHKNKYITVMSFLDDFHKVDRLFSFLALAMLEHYGFIDHGAGIHCAWIAEHMDGVCPDGRVQQIREWATAAPDDL